MAVSYACGSAWASYALSRAFAATDRPKEALLHALKAREACGRGGREGDHVGAWAERCRERAAALGPMWAEAAEAEAVESLLERERLEALPEILRPRERGGPHARAHQIHRDRRWQKHRRAKVPLLQPVHDGEDRGALSRGAPRARCQQGEQFQLGPVSTYSVKGAFQPERSASCCWPCFDQDRLIPPPTDADDRSRRA